jgi:nucleoside-diphosphate kinase
MANNITFTMIKPDAVKKGNIGNILALFGKSGFRISGLKYLQITEDQAKQFYIVHKERPFYMELVAFMSSGPIVAAILEKDNAVEDFRKVIGSTNPADASEGTVRKLYGASIQNNAVHGSDSNENAQVESDFFFSKLERF